jgi:hypothetical protein
MKKLLYIELHILHEKLAIQQGLALVLFFFI